MNRNQMIDEILKEVEDWDIETLIDWVQYEKLIRFKRMSDEEIEEEYRFLIGEEKYE